MSISFLYGRKKTPSSGLAILAAGIWTTLALLVSPRDTPGQSNTSNTRTVLGRQDSRFTLNGQPTFLLGISYYGALGASEDFIRRDLNDMQRHGFNWLRVWATWGAFDNDVSAVDAEGGPREPFLGKLRWLVTECDRRGLVVDVTLTRGKRSATSLAGGTLPDFASHQRAVETLINALTPHRNWYLDLANERDVRDARYVGVGELETLQELARRLDPLLLVTASFGGHDLTDSDIRDALETAKLDFLSPHRPRNPQSPAQTEAQTRACLSMIKALDKIAPVHHQEPFRRGYSQWAPTAIDFLTDLRGALAGGAAGWCFHNGSERSSPDQRPRRSFDLRTQRLFDQLDSEEQRVVTEVSAVLAATIGPPRRAASHSDALLNKDKMLMVHGKPRFLLGLYENPKEDAVLKEAVEAGFNLIQCAPDVAALDRIQRLGAMAWVNVGGALDLSHDTANRRKSLTETVQRVANHPALLIWEAPDEILWNNWWVPMEQLRAELNTMKSTAQGKVELETLSRHVRDLFERGLYAEFEAARAEFWTEAGQAPPAGSVRVDDAPERVRQSGDGITAGIRALREADSRHVIWLNHAPRNSLEDLRLYNRAADMAGCDIYPCPPNLTVGHSDLPDMGLTSVGKYTKRMQQAAPGKACAMVLQGFGWRDLRANMNEHEIAVGIGRRPTWAESRFMAYDAIIHGANAILYWGTAHMKPVEDDGTPSNGRPRLWQDLLRVARELSALEPALIATPLESPVAQQADTYGSIDGNGILYTVRQTDDDFIILVVNETGDGLQFSLEGLPPKLKGRTLYRLYSSEEHQILGRKLTDGIKPRDVHVYATSRRFEDPLTRTQ